MNQNKIDSGELTPIKHLRKLSAFFSYFTGKLDFA